MAKVVSAFDISKHHIRNGIEVLLVDNNAVMLFKVIGQNFKRALQFLDVYAPSKSMRGVPLLFPCACCHLTLRLTKHLFAPIPM
jgi:hypothetical protein